MVNFYLLGILPDTQQPWRPQCRLETLSLERAAFKTQLQGPAAPNPLSPAGTGSVSCSSCGHSHLAGQGWRWKHGESCADTMPFVWGQCWVCSGRRASCFPCVGISLLAQPWSSLPGKVCANLNPGVPTDHLIHPACVGQSHTLKL